MPRSGVLTEGFDQLYNLSIPLGVTAFIGERKFSGEEKTVLVLKKGDADVAVFVNRDETIPYDTVEELLVQLDK